MDNKKANIQSAPRALRTHIGVFGRTNSGKSTLINAITSQKVSTVSDESGTTTDLVNVNMELHGAGPVTFLDTPGFDDETKLGSLRMENTIEGIKKSDIGIYLLSDEVEEDIKHIKFLKEKLECLVIVRSKFDLLDNKTLELEPIIRKYFAENNIEIMNYSYSDNKSVDKIIDVITELVKKKVDKDAKRSITGDLVKEGDLVVLVMPQDKEAPEGRLIMPQVQTIRELLDKSVISINTTPELYKKTIESLNRKPDLVITDSQVFKKVHEETDEDIKLTSFSVLMSAFKGDIEYFTQSVKVLDSLKESSRILIAEACNHPPKGEDIGTVKIPKMLKKRFGENITIDFSRGVDFLKEKDYDLIIHCGACMFTRGYVLRRTIEAKEKSIPMTNYGIVIAYLHGILDKVVYPTKEI